MEGKWWGHEREVMSGKSNTHTLKVNRIIQYSPFGHEYDFSTDDLLRQQSTVRAQTALLHFLNCLVGF